MSAVTNCSRARVASQKRKARPRRVAAYESAPVTHRNVFPLMLPRFNASTNLFLIGNNRLYLRSSCTSLQFGCATPFAFLRHGQRAFCRLATMPPKQGTLGYVRPSQTTLTWASRGDMYVRVMLTRRQLQEVLREAERGSTEHAANKALVCDKAKDAEER